MTEQHRFIWAHREDDPAQLALSTKKYPGISVAHAARQVEALGKIRRKIPSWYQIGMEFPVALSLEQASSEATAHFKSTLFAGQKMADLTGGLGVDASFFAKTFQNVWYVEQSEAIAAAASHNFKVLNLDNVAVCHARAEDFLENAAQQFDLLYLDPARRDDKKGKVFQLADCTPDILKIKALLFSHAPKILVKTAPMLDIHLAVRQLEHVSKIWVVEYEGECREVLYLLEKDAPAAPVPVEVVILDKSGAVLHQFPFTFEEEQAVSGEFAAPLQFLYEPFPAILKAGAFKIFGQRFNLKKLHPNTHLYTAATHTGHIPARAFVIEAICKYDKKAVAPFLPEQKANVSVRNFPDGAEQVRKKLGIKDGGDVYVFAATDATEKKVILVCKKM